MNTPRRLASLVLLGSALSVATSARAQVPNQYIYEGYLEETGTPVNDTVAVTFALHDAITDGPPFYSRPDLFDHARDIGSADVGEFEIKSRDSAPDPQVEMVQGHRPNSHYRGAGSDHGFRSLADLQHFRAAVSSEECSSHLLFLVHVTFDEA